MKILLVIPTLLGGGAERVVVILSQAFVDKGHDVTIITLSGKDTDFYPLPIGVTRIALDILKDSSNMIDGLRGNFRKSLILRNAVCKLNPDVVISHLNSTNVLTIISLLNSGYPVIVTEHSHPKINLMGPIWTGLRRLTYPYANKVVSVSQGVSDAFDWLPSHLKSVIYNPFRSIPHKPTYIDIPPGADIGKKWIISMGRFVHAKGFDILLPAFASIIAKHQDWQLIILGDGELREELEKLKENLGLSTQAILPGAVKNPFPILQAAKLFVMSSRNEGFPMAPGEALACGLPVISTDCPSGPSEIIRSGIDGILVPTEDVSALAFAMDSLMSNEEQRQRLASFAPEVTARFSLEKIVENWESLIEEVIKNKSDKINLKKLNQHKIKSTKK
jgi:GalNAc-alpha-(1->4)-GalNAc-alpha-(1->3)-diNAcBac-PP-undecaprenol alpha-1,4-N-acetyl-D-galactosaminyltransferase